MSTPLDEQYFKYLEDGELRIQRCGDCAHYLFPPAATCPSCLGSNLAWIEVSGRGTLWSWIRMHRQYFPDPVRGVPYNVAFIQLREGPRMMSTIVDPPAELRCDADVELVIGRIGDNALPQFKVVS